MRLFAAASSITCNNGIVVIEEFDRVNSIFLNGFKEIIAENLNPENLSISFHYRYDLITGSYYRLFVRLRDFKMH